MTNDNLKRLRNTSGKNYHSKASQKRSEESRSPPVTHSHLPAASLPRSSWGSSCSTARHHYRPRTPRKRPLQTRPRTRPWPSGGGSTPASIPPNRATGEPRRRLAGRQHEARREPSSVSRFCGPWGGHATGQEKRKRRVLSVSGY